MSPAIIRSHYNHVFVFHSVYGRLRDVYLGQTSALSPSGQPRYPFNTSNEGALVRLQIVQNQRGGFPANTTGTGQIDRTSSVCAAGVVEGERKYSPYCTSP